MQQYAHLYLQKLTKGCRSSFEGRSPLLLRAFFQDWCDHFFVLSELECYSLLCLPVKTQAHESTFICVTTDELCGSWFSMVKNSIKEYDVKKETYAELKKRNDDAGQRIYDE